MTVDWASIGVMIGIGGLLWRQIHTLDVHVRSQGERLAKLEGKVDTLIAAFVKPGTQT